MIELFKKLHVDERGSLSLETILIIAAIALPVIIFIYKIGWPAIREIFEAGMKDLNLEEIYSPLD